MRTHFLKFKFGQWARRGMRRIGPDALWPEVEVSDEPVAPHDVIVLVTAGRALAKVHPTAFGRPEPTPLQARGCVKAHLGAALHLARLAEGVSISVNLSDGDLPSGARFAFSAAPGGVVPLPDPYFIYSRGFAEFREAAKQAARPWAERSDRLVWRGGANGQGYRNFAPGFRDHPALVQRIRAAHVARDLGLDFGFVAVRDNADQRLLAHTGFSRGRVNSTDWGGMKFALDIDGYTNTWDNLMHRMMLGCCLLKVESQFGYRQWYYDRLRPFEHFVPVRADLSDLAEKLDWVCQNDAAARDIASAGQALVAEMTFETEMNWAGQRIREMA
jgi:hypothetical protein